MRRLAPLVTVIAAAVLAAETDPVVEAGPHILLPPARTFIDMEQAFCFLMYAQVFALSQSLRVGNTPLIASLLPPV